MNNYNDKLKSKQETLKRKISSFSSYYFKKDIEELCLNIVDIMSQQEHVMFMQGKLKNWASAIVYLVARLNCMFNNLIFETLRNEDIEEFFKTKSNLYTQLANRINKKLHISDNKDFKIRAGEGNISDFLLMNHDGDICYYDGIFIRKLV